MSDANRPLWKKVIFNYYTAFILLIISILGIIVSKEIISFVISILFVGISITVFIEIRRWNKSGSKQGGKKMDAELNPKIWKKICKNDNFIVLKYKRKWLGFGSVNHLEVLKVCNLMRSHDYVLRSPLEDVRGTFFYFELMRSEDLEYGR